MFPTLEVTAGDNFCIEVKTEDFTDLLTIDFVIVWDRMLFNSPVFKSLTPLVDDFDIDN
ncbi:MAG: hypothetical protein R2769_17310 [Saprospiraceae bacterium]